LRYRVLLKRRFEQLRPRLEYRVGRHGEREPRHNEQRERFARDVYALQKLDAPSSTVR